jgi:hypothetical protein
VGSLILLIFVGMFVAAANVLGVSGKGICSIMDFLQCWCMMVHILND